MAWIDNKEDVFSKISKEIPIKSLNNAFQKMECIEGQTRFKVLWGMVSAQMIIVKPQVLALNKILETTLPVYQGLDKTLKVSTSLGKLKKANLVKPAKIGKSCFKDSFTNQISGNFISSSNSIIGGLNSIISSGVNIEHQLKSFVSNLLGNIAKSWMNSSDSIVFPLIEALEAFILSTGIGSSLKQLTTAYSCLQKECKLKADQLPNMSKFYVNGKLMVPVNSKGQLDISKLWVFDLPGTGLNTKENKELLNKLSARYNKYSKEKAKLAINGFGPIFNELAGLVNNLYSGASCLAGNLNMNLVNPGLSLIDDAVSGVAGPLGSIEKSVSASLSSATSFLNKNLGIPTGMSGLADLAGQSIPSIDPLKNTVSGFYGDATASVSDKYEAIKSAGNKNNALASSSKMLADAKATTSAVQPNVVVQGVISKVTATVDNLIPSISLPSISLPSVSTSCPSTSNTIPGYDKASTTIKKLL